MGKLRDKELKTLLSCVKKNKRVIISPIAGYDSGVHMLDGKCVVVSTDPCTGVPEEWFGWLLINYAASDVALFGAKPEFCTINLLGPEKTDAQEFQKIMKQACSAADELGISIVGGHTGTYSSLCGLLGVCTAYGTVEPEKLITPAKAQAGDYILCTKSLGLEILVNFARAHKDWALKLFGKQPAEDLITQMNMQSCVKEARLLAKFSGVHAMHDATEEGIVTALNELADASNLGFKVEHEKMPITAQMHAFQKHFSLSDLQVLSASSTGTILAAVDRNDKDEIIKKLLEKGVAASFVGYFTKDKKRVLTKDSRDSSFPKVADDPYAMILSGKAGTPEITS